MQSSPRMPLIGDASLTANQRQMAKIDTMWNTIRGNLFTLFVFFSYPTHPCRQPVKYFLEVVAIGDI